MLLDYVKLKDIKPFLSGYVWESLSMLDPSVMPLDNTVHDLRVLMKKSRATMRLVRAQTDNEFYEREYHTFRETGRILRSWRETSVYRKLLKEFRKRFPAVFTKLADNDKINNLMQKTGPVPDISPDVRKDIEKVIVLLKKSGYRIRFQTMNNLDPRLLLRELEESFSIVTDCYIYARNNPRAVNLHEFRKRAKDFLYQLYFFRPVRPPAVKGLEKKLDAMTRNLGRYNDLAGLIKTIGYKYTHGAASTALDELVILLRNEQDKCLLKVWPVAYKIFCPGQSLINLLGFKLLIL